MKNQGNRIFGKWLQYFLTTIIAVWLVIGFAILKVNILAPMVTWDPGWRAIIAVGLIADAILCYFAVEGDWFD